MLPEHRRGLLELRARLDQLETQANDIIGAPVYPDVGALAEELRNMRAEVEEHLEQA